MRWVLQDDGVSEELFPQRRRVHRPVKLCSKEKKGKKKKKKNEEKKEKKKKKKQK